MPIENMNDVNNDIVDDMEINIDVNVGPDNRLGNVEFIDPETEQRYEHLPNNPAPNQNGTANQGTNQPNQRQNTNNPQANNNNNNNNGNNANQFTNVRDRLFHAMLVRVALKYSAKVNILTRRIIETFFLFTALVLLFSLIFVHFKFTRSSTTCLDEMKPEWFKNGFVRVEVVRNLKMLEDKERFIKSYVRKKSERSCFFDPINVFKYGPDVIPAEIRALGYSIRNKRKSTVTPPPPVAQSTHQSLLSYFIRAPTGLFFFDRSADATDETPADYENEEEIEEDRKEEEAAAAYSDPLELEANYAWDQLFRSNYDETQNFAYIYRVEYAMLYGVLRLPLSYREKHDIPASRIRIDSKSLCFGDTLTRVMMHLFVGYEDAIIAALRAHAMNMSAAGESSSMGYLHDLETHEHYHFVANVLGRTSYITAGILMLVFTFAISMLLRFSHHQIFIFIIDLLHMFELQQPLHFPVAPIFTVILALVGMEAIMSEVFNDTTTAFYVILIVWIADQYDAICCHSPISKRFWLRSFYIYQYFFYAYQYRFGGQYGSLALWTSAVFILHSMIYFFHHYEMPLILYQDRVQQVLADLHSPQNGMGTVEVQTITVAVHNRAPPQLVTLPSQREANTPANQPENVVAQPLSPSSVFDARGPVFVPREEPAPEVLIVEEPEPTNPEEIVAHRLVNEAMNELFNSPQE